MRQAFIDTLERLALRDKNIFLLNGDLGFSVLEGFTTKFPKRSLNMGVAEANMIGAAAGLAMSGKTVFVYSIIPFVTARVYEQIRNDVTLQKANVKIVGVGSGLTYGQLGPTHHSIDDIALMRTLPNMTVFCPGDPIETVLATEKMACTKGPMYLRLGKKGEPRVHIKNPKFEIGKGIVLENGRDLTIIATGNMLPVGVAVTKALCQHGKRACLISMHTIKPIDAALVKKAMRDTSHIFTLEEHSIIGGLGSAVAEVIAEEKVSLKAFYRFGIRDKFTYQSGSQDYLRNIHELSVDAIIAKITALISK